MDYPKNKQHTKTSIYIKKPAESFNSRKKTPVRFTQTAFCGYLDGSKRFRTQAGERSPFNLTRCGAG